MKLYFREIREEGVPSLLIRASGTEEALRKMVDLLGLRHYTMLDDGEHEDDWREKLATEVKRPGDLDQMHEFQWGTPVTSWEIGCPTFERGGWLVTVRPMLPQTMSSHVEGGATPQKAVADAKEWLCRSHPCDVIGCEPTAAELGGLSRPEWEIEMQSLGGTQQ